MNTAYICRLRNTLLPTISRNIRYQVSAIINDVITYFNVISIFDLYLIFYWSTCSHCYFIGSLPHTVILLVHLLTLILLVHLLTPLLYWSTCSLCYFIGPLAHTVILWSTCSHCYFIGPLAHSIFLLVHSLTLLFYWSTCSLLFYWSNFSNCFLLAYMHPLLVEPSV